MSALSPTPARAEFIFWLILCGGLATGVALEFEASPTSQPTLPFATSGNQYSPPLLVDPFRLPPVDSMLDTAMRPVFVSTRRPGPPPEAVAKPTMRKGQFLLTGVSMSGNARFAYLTEKSSGQNLVVSEGKVIKGITVKEIQADRIELSQGDESESVPLLTAKSAPADTGNKKAASRTTRKPLAVPPPDQSAPDTQSR